MSNPSNILRPAVLNPPNPQPNEENRDINRQVTEIVNRILNERAIARNVVEVDEQVNVAAANGIGELDKIPDVVRCLREFSGDPGEFGSWKKSVERILQIYEAIRGSHKYFGIISVIRNKIIGHADIVLESYNTPLNWAAISRCLTTHYGDKRDLGTLEYQMSSLIQGNLSIQEFYQKVYTNLSLILNKISCLDAGMESRTLLVSTYRNKALDTFIRGLNGDLPRLLGIREPSNLPEALQLCLKLENQTFRANVAHYNSRKTHHATPPPPPLRRNSQPQTFYPHLNHWNQPMQGHRHYQPSPNQQWQRQQNFNPQTSNQQWQRQRNFNTRPQIFNQQWQQAPPRPFAPKPLPKAEPMEIDQSIQTRGVNYINRPAPNPLLGKRPPHPTQQLYKPNKFQRNFHINSEIHPNEENYGQFEETHNSYPDQLNQRWKARLEEYNYELIYKPDRTNVVADALSRPPQISHINSLTGTQHSDESSAHNLIPAVEAPINTFKNQIWLLSGEENSYQFKIPFPTFHRHIFIQHDYTDENLISIFKRYLNPSVINGIFTSEPIMGKIQQIYPLHFSKFKIRFTQTQVEDLPEEDNQEIEILKEHKRAHRNPQENKIQILQKFYFPKMNSKIENIVKQCKICKENKYDRHPNKPQLLETPIPQYPGEIVHIDIYNTEKRLVLTAVDKFSKYAQVKLIDSKASEDIREPLRQIIFAFGVPKFIIVDNEKALNSASIRFMLEDQLQIQIYKTPPYTSTVNGQVERFHSTVTEIMRCLKAEKIHRSFSELLDRSVYEYNYTIHSTIGKRPIEAFFGRRVSTNPEQYENSRKENIEAIKKKQEKDLEVHNKKRTPMKTYSPGDVIYVRINKRLGSKLTARYKKEIVREDKSSIVITEKGRTVHKSNIKT